jgi:hypothetical protein
MGGPYDLGRSVSSSCGQVSTGTLPQQVCVLKLGPPDAEGHRSAWGERRSDLDTIISVLGTMTIVRIGTFKVDRTCDRSELAVRSPVA